MLTNNRFLLLLFIFVSFSSCKEEANKTSDIKKNEEVTIAIDSGAFKVDKKDYQIESVIKDVKPSSQSEVEALVKGEKLENLDKYQSFAQDFLTACAEKDYNKASQFLAFKGADVTRKNKVAYNVSNANEMNVVKTTVDVVFGFLAESKNYKFVNSKEKVSKVGKTQNLEVTFFKKGMGINRHYFEVMDTDKGMLIYNMK